MTLWTFIVHTASSIHKKFKILNTIKDTKKALNKGNNQSGWNNFEKESHIPPWHHFHLSFADVFAKFCVVRWAYFKFFFSIVYTYFTGTKDLDRSMLLFAQCNWKFSFSYQIVLDFLLITVINFVVVGNAVNDVVNVRHYE